MAYERKPGDITLFINESENRNAPKWKGTMIIPLNAKPGDVISVSLWGRTSQKGVEYLAGVGEPRPSSATARGEYAPPAYQSAAQVPDKDAAARLATAQSALAESLEPNPDDLPF